MTKQDWIFVCVFYTHGLALIALGVHSMPRLAGCGLFGMLFGFVAVLTATYNIKLPPDSNY
jgi:hypothetical protein